MSRSRVLRSVLLVALFTIPGSLLFAQQTGTIIGQVRASDGGGLPGVTVEASSNVLPQTRVVTTSLNGDYRLSALPVGQYTVRFSLAGMATQERNVNVRLGQESAVNMILGLATLAEEIVVTADAPFTDPTSTALRSSISQEMLDQLPLGQEYRDLLKLAPAIQYTETAVRGPSAGGSGQDNVYEFDGVNVTLPLFGTLAAEPSAHDIAQVEVVKGGAKAVDFNRAGGFTIDTVSKSGTNEWSGDLKYEFQTDGMIADRDGATGSTFDQDRDWLSLGVGGPVVEDMLFVYGSYYRPTVDRENRANAYGEVPNFDSTRDEYFGKMTFTPTSNLLLNVSYRDSDREARNASIGSFSRPTTSTGESNSQTIGIFEGSWIVTDRSFVTAKYNDYELLTSSRPDLVLNVVPGGNLNLDILDQLGLFLVPSLGNDEAFNAFAAPFVERYGFLRDGVRTGGGAVGAASTFNDQDFYRTSYQLGYDITLGDMLTHDIHIGYQWYRDEEDLSRFSNGFGVIELLGGREEFNGQPAFFKARYQRSNVSDDPGQIIHSEFESSNIEINDTIRMDNWSFNVGVMLSNDTLYGQGLREDPTTISGYVSAPGNKYKMYEIDFEDQIQPRLGATWAYNGSDTVYASYSRYNPAASSLPRAASWDRNTLGLVTEAFYDMNGALIGSEQLGGSSGKLFVENMDPRYTDEYLVGTGRQLTPGLAGRAYVRYRYSSSFWEDTNNNARVNFEPPEGIPRTLYIPDLNEKRNQIGSGSSYVIAELDGAFTKYWEATLESDWRATDNVFLRGTYTWSHYYGNFDQDGTSAFNGGDFATFIGSSFLADGAGRQIWDNKYGNLRGDRRHLLKLYGTYDLPWAATLGAFGLYQSGHAWEAWSVDPYRHLTSSSSDTNRYAEPAGSRTTDAHYQVDLNYTQNIPLGRTSVQLIAEVLNLFDKQTGYSPNPVLRSSLFGVPALQYAPRRFELAARLRF